MNPFSESIGSAIGIGPTNEPITTRLVLDCMGNGSPISAQQRYGIKPDGIVPLLVHVGSCAAGYDSTTNKMVLSIQATIADMFI